ncbi:MAG TPA: PilZ domain-containing protein [Planctomycetota bacterium]|jgi:hypothetical protein|nr:PilZ domain-containing protein [Planctomycetota bacterium]
MKENSRRSNEPRRKHKRFSPTRTNVVCIPRGFWASILRRNIAVHVKDVSLGGAQIVASRALRAGAKTDVLLDFPGFPRPLSAEADVRWCRRDTLSLEPRWNAGLIFKKLSPADEAQLREVDRTYLG